MEKILIIDDEQAAGDTIKKHLELDGYQVLTAADGQNVIDLFRKEHPTVVITGLKMPNMDGLATMKALKEIDNDVEVIVMTGQDDFNAAMESLRLGASDFILKPMDINNLEVTLERALDKQRIKQEVKKAREALLKSEAKYSGMVERANDGIVIVQDGVFKFANSRMTDLTKYSIQELTGMEFEKLLAPDSIKITKERHEKRMAGKEAPDFYEINILDKEGNIMPVEANGGLYESDGRPADLVFLRDIRERKAAEAEIKRTIELYSGPQK